MKRLPTLGAALGACLFVRPVAATPPPGGPPSDGGAWGLEAEVLTEFPSLLGGGVRLLAPRGLEVSTSIGWLPGGYTAVIGDALHAFDALSEAQADTIMKAFEDSLVLRASVAWRPFTEHGLWLEAGYSLVTLGGDATGRDLLVLATGADPGPMPAEVEQGYDMGITAHRLHLGLGWRWRLPAGWSLRAGVGADVTLAASATVGARFDPRDPVMVRAFEATAEKGIDELVVGYVHNPTVILNLGYRFF